MSPLTRSPLHTSRPSIWLWLICGAFAALCLINNAVLPLFEASDEAAHFGYADFLVRERRPPDLRIETPSHEAFQPPLYYASVALVIAPFRYSPSDLRLISLLNRDWFDLDVNADHASVANQHLHTGLEHWPYSGVAWAVHAARALSTVLGIGVVLCVFWIGTLMARVTAKTGALMPILAAALVAFNPKFIHLSSVVTNDIAVTFGATLACAWMIRITVTAATDSPRRVWWQFFVLGGCIGLAMLCKIQALGLLAPAVLMLVVRFRSARWALALPALAGGFLLTAGWWLVGNSVRYGDPLAWSQVQQMNAALERAAPLTAPDILQRIPQLFITFWGVLGIEKVFPGWVDALFFAGLAVAVIGLVTRMWREVAGRGRWLRRDWLILLAWQAALLALFLSWMRTHVGTENSRLLMPGSACIALLVAQGWLAVLPDRTHAGSVLVVSGALFVLSAVTPFTVLVPAFATPPTLNQTQLNALAPSGINLKINDELHLWSADLMQRVVKPGASVNIRLLWGALDQPIPTSYRVFLEAIDQAGEVVGRKRFIPFRGRYATTQWAPSVMFEDQYELPIDATAARGTAVIRLAIQRPDQAASLLPLPNGAQRLVIGTIKIDGAASVQPNVATALDARFGSIARLIGFTLVPRSSSAKSASAKPVNTDLILSLTGLQPPAAAGTGRDAVLFVHLLDAAGLPISQEDDSPLGDRFTPRWWDNGDVIQETRAINLTTEVARIEIGFYDPVSKERLPALKPDGTRWVDDTVVIWRRP